MGRLAKLGMVGGMAVACAASTPYSDVAHVVADARADQLSFSSKYQKKGLAFRGTVQKKGVKASTGAGFDFSAYGISDRGGGPVTVSGTSRRVNINYGYVFIGEGTDETKRALCLFDPDDLSDAAALQIGQPATLTCLFSKFVGDTAAPTPVFSGCSVVE